MKYKINGAGDLFRKSDKWKMHQCFFRGYWLKGLFADTWDLPVLKDISEADAKNKCPNAF